MAGKISYGVGAHEPIFHRMRTGNATAQEWQRWQRETSVENLDLLGELGVARVQIACTKGFGLHHEKPAIERAARFAEAAGQRGIRTHIYVQGFPVYYETFLLEVPQAEGWLARRQNGDYIPWGGQTFRRWIDPTCTAFHDYQRKLLEYVLKQFTPDGIGMDNTVPPAWWSDRARGSFRAYLRRKFAEADPVREFGIPGFDAVDLPRFDPVYYPRDAYRIVKDPLLQEWAFWRSWVVCEFLRRMREFIRSLAPGVPFYSGAGCDALRYNHLFNSGVDFEPRLEILDAVGMEESGWRPGLVEARPGRERIVKDERVAEADAGEGHGALRVSTDSRWMKICSEYGKGTHRGFWGEVDRSSKLVALAHNLAFSDEATDLGTIGPLAAAAGMLDDIADLIEWCGDHVAVLAGRQRRFAPVAVWRSTATIGFLRHQPVWEACAVEQMLYEQHLPFTILLDGGLERFLAGRRLLVLPGAACVSDRQVEVITEFVGGGGGLLLLGAAGTRDERTRLRRRHAFEHLFGGSMPQLEYFGPPHWVPELDLSAMPERLAADFGRGRVALVRDIVPSAPLDLTRDPYMPERQVMAKDIVPPANAGEILAELDRLLGPGLRVRGPRWTLCEFWRRGSDLVVCCANLHRHRDGGPLTLELGSLRPRQARVHVLFEPQARTLQPAEGRVQIESLPRFAAIELAGVP